MIKFNLLWSLAFVLLLSGCDKSEEIRQSGCTDPFAENYDADADIDDGSCTFLSKQQMIFNDGALGDWNGESFTGAITIAACRNWGGLDTVLLDGVKVLALLKDSVFGKFGMVASIANDRDAPEFKRGYLKFDARLPVSSNVTFFNVFIHGTNCDNINCNKACRSDYVTIQTSGLNTSSFTTISIPLLDFLPASFVSMSNVFGVSYETPGGGDTAIFINNIRWDTDL